MINNIDKINFDVNSDELKEQFDCFIYDKRNIEDIIRNINKNAKKVVIKSVLIYLYFEKHASIIFLRRRGVFSHYVWDSVEELITIILKHKKLFSLKENEINYLNNKINNSSWLKNAYAFIDKEINELICVHIQNSVCYDECQTSLFYELLVYIEYRFRYHKYEKKIDNNNCLNLDDVDSYSNEDIAEAVSYILKLINKCKENNRVYHKFLWMDDNYILSEELNKILLLSLKRKKIIDCEIKNDYFDYNVENKGKYYYVGDDINCIEKDIKIGYTKKELKDRAEMYNFIKNEHKGSFYYRIKELFEKYKEILFVFKNEKEYLQRYSILIPELVVKLICNFDENNNVKLYDEEILDLQRIAHEMYLPNLHDMLNFKITENCSIVDIIKFKRMFFVIYALQSLLFEKSIDTNIIFHSIVPNMSLDDLKRQLKLVFDSDIKISELISLFTFNDTSFDLQSAPLYCYNDIYFILPYLISISDLVRNSIAMQKHKLIQNINSDGTDDKLINAIESSMKKQKVFNFKKNVKFAYKGKDGEIDMLIWNNDYIFILEAKNAILPTDSMTLRTTYDYTIKAEKQLLFSKSALSDQNFSNQFFVKLGINITHQNIISCIILGNRLFTCKSSKNFVVRSELELDNIISSGKLLLNNSVFNYWRGDNFSAEDLVRYMSEDDYISKAFYASMVPYLERFNINEKELFIKTYIFVPELYDSELRKMRKNY